MTEVLGPPDVVARKGRNSNLCQYTDVDDDCGRRILDLSQKSRYPSTKSDHETIEK